MMDFSIDFEGVVTYLEVFHTQLQLYVGEKKLAENGTYVSFLSINQAFKWAQKQKSSIGSFWENPILSFLLT